MGAQIVDASRTREIRKEIEIGVEGAAACRVGVAHVTERNLVIDGRIVRHVIRIACHAQGAQRIAGAAAVHAADFIVRIVLVGGGYVAAAVREIVSCRDREVAVAGITVPRNPALATDTHSVKVALGHEVHDAGHAVRTVDRRDAAGQHIDALDEIQWHGVDVHRSRAGHARHMSTAVYQHECPVDAEIAQVQQVQAGIARPYHLVSGGVIAGGRVHQRRALRQQVHEVRVAGLLDVLRFVAHDGIRRVALWSGYARARDDDGFQFAVLETVGRQGRRCEREGKEQAKAGATQADGNARFHVRKNANIPIRGVSSASLSRNGPRKVGTVIAAAAGGPPQAGFHGNAAG